MKQTDTKHKDDIVDFFRNSPLFGVNLDIAREEQYERKIDLGSDKEGANENEQK